MRTQTQLRENIRGRRPLEMAVHPPEPMPKPDWLTRHGGKVGMGLVLVSGASVLCLIHWALCLLGL